MLMYYQPLSLNPQLVLSLSTQTGLVIAAILKSPIVMPVLMMKQRDIRLYVQDVILAIP